MKIVTVNVPESYLDVIEKLIGNNGLYPSRSELIRCAVRAFLIKELKIAKKIQHDTIKKENKHFNDKDYVNIPVGRPDKKGNIHDFKTYKIIRRLEY